MSRAIMQAILTQIQNDEEFDIVGSGDLVSVYILHRNYPMIKLRSQGEYIVIELHTGLKTSQKIPVIFSEKIFRLANTPDMLYLWTQTNNQSIALMRFGVAVGIALRFFD